MARAFRLPARRSRHGGAQGEAGRGRPALDRAASPHGPPNALRSRRGRPTRRNCSSPCSRSRGRRPLQLHDPPCACGTGSAPPSSEACRGLVGSSPARLLVGIDPERQLAGDLVGQRRVRRVEAPGATVAEQALQLALPEHPEAARQIDGPVHDPECGLDDVAGMSLPCSACRAANTSPATASRRPQRIDRFGIEQLSRRLRRSSLLPVECP